MPRQGRLSVFPRTRAVALLLGSALALTSCGSGEPTAPEDHEYSAILNGLPVAGAGRALLWGGTDAPDTLQIAGFAGRFLVEIKVEYRGPGRYELAPEATRLWSYAPDSYLKTGEYRGSTTTTAGELVLSRATGIGGDVVGEFSFQVLHVGGEARLGLTATVRSGRINRYMQLPFDP